VEDKCSSEVEHMLKQQWVPGETPDAYALRMMECRQFVAAARWIISIPRESIQMAKEER
jgi:hypothetical protein